MELTGKRVAVLAENYYENLELWYPVLRLREAGATVYPFENHRPEGAGARIGRHQQLRF